MSKKRIGIVVLAASMVACGGEEKKAKAPMPTAPSAAKTRMLGDGARAGTLAGAQPQQPMTEIRVRGQVLVRMAEAAAAWVVRQDLDDDGAADDVLVILEPRTDNVYLIWDAKLQDDSCSDARAVNLVLLKRSGDFSVVLVASCGQDLGGFVGCDFSAAGACKACGVCGSDGTTIACQISDSCQ